MKVKARLVTAAVFLLIAAVGAVLTLNRLFPKAAPLSVPAASAVTSLSVTPNGGESVAAAQTDTESILQYLQQAQPTRRISVQDFPAVRPYYTITVTTPERIFTYFLYEENARTYAESPYEGIYEADPHLLALLTEYFSD